MITIKVLNALLTPLIAVIALYIAYQQYKSNRKNSEIQNLLTTKKLNLELYEKRFRIFNETKKILLEFSRPEIDVIILRDFLFSINDRKFLFGDDLNSFIDKVEENAKELRVIAGELKNWDNNDLRSEKWNIKNKRYNELVGWFENQFEGLEYKFLPYLDFRIL